MIGPDKSLPLPRGFSSSDEYVDSLLNFVTSSQSLQTLCGGVHILDFFTRTPDLYCTIIPEDWRAWFNHHDVQDILDFLNKEDASQFLTVSTSGEEQEQGSWRGKPLPPRSLAQYVHDVQRHCLDTSFTPAADLASFTRTTKAERKYTPSLKAMTQGMSPKKLHEVSNFSHFVSGLADRIEQNDVSKVTHVVDFGSGQNYLGRTLASDPYCKDIVAVESRPHVVQGAIKMDSRVNLVDQKLVLRNKKVFRNQKFGSEFDSTTTTLNISPALSTHTTGRVVLEDISNTPAAALLTAEDSILRAADNTIGRVHYIEHRIQDGDLSDVVRQIPPPPAQSPIQKQDPSLIVISLHSCGNLSHHGLRALTLNPSVRAVAIIGCCYNMLTERSNAPLSKIPLLRENHPRLYEPSTHNDPHGFPMSTKLLTHKHSLFRAPVYSTSSSVTHEKDDEDEQESGIHLNITARMMAVQAPRNWTPTTSTAFFTRHFFRALLQRILMDRGVIAAPTPATSIPKGRSPAGTGSTALDGTAPVVIGNLSKPCYASFTSYVRGAVAKLCKMAERPREVDGWNSAEEVARQYRDAVTVAETARTQVGSMTDEEMEAYEERYAEGRKQLSVVWSLMAFSAQVTEAVIVVDRWLWLREQENVQEAWVQTVFDYGLSPRNMCVIGIKKKGHV